MSTLSRLPDGFEFVKSGRTLAAVRSSARDELLALGVLDEERFEEARASGCRVGGGRGSAVSVALDPETGERAVVRHYHRGGLLGRMLGDRYWGRARALEELQVWEKARRAGVPSPECLAAVVRRRGVFCSADLVVREVPHAVSLEQWLHQNADAPPDAMRDVQEAVAGAFQKLFGAGIYHRDLHAGNVLIQNVDGATRAYVIDFDRAVQVKQLSRRQRSQMLYRFNRALVKRGLAPRPVTLRARVRFCRALGVAGNSAETRRFVGECGAHLKRHAWRY